MISSIFIAFKDEFVRVALVNLVESLVCDLVGGAGDSLFLIKAFSVVLIYS